jgi:hypothetical protein
VQCPKARSLRNHHLRRQARAFSAPFASGAETRVPLGSERSKASILGAISDVVCSHPPCGEGLGVGGAIEHCTRLGKVHKHGQRFTPSPRRLRGEGGVRGCFVQLGSASSSHASRSRHRVRQAAARAGFGRFGHMRNLRVSVPGPSKRPRVGSFCAPPFPRAGRSGCGLEAPGRHRNDGVIFRHKPCACEWLRFEYFVCFVYCVCGLHAP